MVSDKWRGWLVQYGLPVFVLAASYPATWLTMRWLSDAGEPEFFWALIVAPLLIFLIGFVVQPRHAWVVPVTLMSLFAIFVAIAEGGDINNVEGFIAFLFFIGLLLTFLLWVGTALRQRLTGHHGADDRGRPRAPA